MLIRHKKDLFRKYILYTVGILSIFIFAGALFIHREKFGFVSATTMPEADLALRHYRIVWSQDRDKNRDVFAQGIKLALMGFDSNDGIGERQILKNLDNYSKPLLTPSGRQIVFYIKDKPKSRTKAYVVNWDGSGLRSFARGRVLDTWRDLSTGEEWVIVQDNPGEGEPEEAPPVFRYLLSNLKKRKIVWDGRRVPVSQDSFQLSADGKYAAGLFPWPQAGIADINAQKWTKLGKGCWTSMAPDNSYRMWIFDGSHRNITIHEFARNKKWTLPINSAPGMDGYEVYHPRWSNRPRYIVLSGPYKFQHGINNVRGGGPDIEIYIGKFNDKYTAIEKWIQVTRNTRADFFPDLWIQVSPETLRKRDRKAVKVMKAGEKWPVSQQDLAFVWESETAANQMQDIDGRNRICRLYPKGKAKYTRFRGMDVTKGYFATRKLEAELVSDFRKKHAFTIEALIRSVGPEPGKNSPIFSYQTTKGQTNVMLGQKGSQLIIKLNGQVDPEYKHAGYVLTRIEQGKDIHLAVTYQKGQLICYVNGKRVHRLKISGDRLSSWLPGEIFVGKPDASGNKWRGNIEGVAFFSRALATDEIKEDADIYLSRVKKRKPVSRLKIEALLDETSPTPRLQDILPYRRALVVYSYTVKKIFQGNLKARQILVAQWAILDGRAIINTPPLGSSHMLLLEKFGAHPELEGERLIMETELLDAPLFYALDSSGN